MKRYEVWIADLNPRFGTEAGKTRPVVVVQTDLLNGKHSSAIVCPLTTKVVAGLNRMRVHLATGEAGLSVASDILVDQIRAIDNRRFLQKLGQIPLAAQMKLDENLKIILDLL
ncbi:MAG: type II toxin-antitoxin system PemK/MazF family toxin [Haliscomenobacteraceae bacterium CHB4]|nr:Endoribonuclease EndoA [Saprospiraceae bacterium]MCE7921507.1 type II toxin-antitoxin system PemK/MazF family toxin [Haliscomenobacteraceae bacterium CHB4]